MVDARFEPNLKALVLYRPFITMWHYTSPFFNEVLGQIRKFFNPDISHNLGICVSGSGSNSSFSCLMTNKPVTYDTLEKTRCYPLMFHCEDKKHHDHSLLLQAKKRKLVMVLQMRV